MPVNTALAQETWARYAYARDRGHLDFINKADKCDNFFAGKQWSDKDVAKLQASRRPALTINKILSTLSTIMGEQIYNRTEVLFRPRAGAPAEVAEALTKVWLQISANNQLPWVRSDVFADGIIRSRGFYDVRLSFTDSMTGEIAISQMNSKNVVIDPDAEEYDPDFWSDVMVTKWLTYQDIVTLYNKEDAEYLKLHSSGNYTQDYDTAEQMRDRFAGPYLQGMYYGGAGDTAEVERNIRVLERQYRRLDKQAHFVDVMTGDMRPVPTSWDHNRISAMLEKMQGQVAITDKLVKRIRWVVTAGSVVLHDDWSPYKHFTVVPYFPYFRYGRTIGLVENLLGPQEILNKVSSQELHVINTTANSGWIIEQNSLVNMSIEELEQRGAETGLVIEFKGQVPPQKIAPNQVPTGLDRLTYKAEEHIKGISGVSDSMQGFDREDVAAKAIASKQQRGAVNLAKAMDNLERTDWILARNVLDIVQEYYTEHRLINITHDNSTYDQESVEVNAYDEATGTILNDLTIGEYDIVVTSAPYRASLEDTQFEQARALRELGIQIPDSVLIENSHLLRRGEIIKQLEEAANSPEAQAQKELEQRHAQAEVSNLEAEAQSKGADAQLKMARSQKEGIQAQNEANGGDEMAKMELEMQVKQQEMELKKQELEMQLQMKREEHAMNMQIKQEEHQLDMQLKQQDAAARRAQMLRQQAQQNQAQESKNEAV
jgi:hypothetical protein